MRYATGLSIPDPFILLDHRNREVLVSALEYGRVRKGKSLVVGKLEEYLGKERTLSGAAVELLRARDLRHVKMAPDASAALVDRLREHGITVTFGELYPERRRKSEAEVRKIVAVRNAVVVGLRAALRVIRCARPDTRGRLRDEEGLVTVLRLKRLVRAELLKRDCEAPSLIMSHGRQTADPHDEGSGTLHANEPVVLDLFARSMRTGYWFDMTRSIHTGQPPREYRLLWSAVRAAQDAALATVKAGVAAATVHRAAETAFAERGYTTCGTEGFIHSTGHGVGLELHESPGVGQGKGRLRAGDVITIEPGLYYASVGGVRLENTILVTRDGYRDLTRVERVMR